MFKSLFKTDNTLIKQQLKDIKDQQKLIEYLKRLNKKNEIVLTKYRDLVAVQRQIIAINTGKD